MTLAELRTLIQAHGFATDTATAQTALINSVYREIAAERHWSWLKAQNTAHSLTAGTSTITVNIADLRAIEAVRLRGADGFVQDLEYRDPQLLRSEEVIDSGSTALSTAIPLYWTLTTPTTLAFDVKADVAYTALIDYVKKITALSADGDTPIFPADNHDVLAWGALARLGTRARDWDLVNLARSEYTTLLRSLRAADGLQQRQSSSRVVESGFYGDPGYYGSF